MAGTAQNRYALLKTIRDPFLQRGRECSALTIPAMLPPDGHTGYAKLPTPWQALGARCLNTLSNRIALALFPPSTTFFKLSLDDFALEALTKQKGMRGEVEKALNKIERAVCLEIETAAMRPSLVEASKHLILAGNVLLYLPPEGSLRLYRLDSYVVKRDPSGNVLEIITHEKLSPLEVPEAAQHLIPAATEAKSGEDFLNLYTHVKRTDSGWRVNQELEGKVVPGSRGTYPKDKLPFLALRLTAIDNEDYGRGLVEEYLGDFKSLEALTKAITQGAAAAAKVLYLIKPNATTKAKVLTESESGEVHEGNAEDVTVLQMQKYADFKVALDLRNSLKEDLSYAFLLNSAIQRNGERVTAEEIRYMAQELEVGLGGIYSNQSVELQLPLVTLLMGRLEKQKRLPALPRKFIKPAITTGLDAIGRGNDRTRIAGFISDLGAVDKTGGIIQRNIIEPELVKRLGVGAGIDMEGLVKTAEEIGADSQQQQLMALVQKLGPNAINKIGDLVKQQQAAPTQ